MTDQYAGMIKTPDVWWMARSRAVFDAFDLPEGAVRDVVLSDAERRGLLVNLGPASMDSAHAMAAARRVLGEEVLPEEALEGFQPHTQRGQDFVNGTGEFAEEPEGS